MSSALLIHEGLCLALFFTVFCRSVKSDQTTRLAIRLSFLLLGAVSLLGVVAPLIWGWEPTVFSSLLMVAFTVVQTVTGSLWSQGVPDQFKTQA